MIPLYRDESALDAILERCAPVLERYAPAELVLVDDGGGADRTTTRAISLAGNYPHAVTVVRLARNFGQHPAVFAGLEHARGDIVVTLDSDLQYPPEDIPKLVDRVTPEVPVVSGYRADRRDPFPRSLVTRTITNYLNRKTGTQLRDFGSMFRAYDRSTVDRMLQLTERHRYVPAVVAWLGVPIEEVPVAHAARGEKGSRYRLSTLLDLLLDLVTGYSVAPMRWLTGVGLAAAFIGFLITAFFAVYRVVAGDGGAGAVSAFAGLFALSTIQLLLLAVISEFIGRIYTEAKGRPYYLTAELWRSDAAGVEAAPERVPAARPV